MAGIPLPSAPNTTSEYKRNLLSEPTYRLFVGDYGAYVQVGNDVRRLSVVRPSSPTDEATAAARLESYISNIEAIIGAISSAGRKPSEFTIAVKGPATGAPRQLKAIAEGQNVESHYASLVPYYQRLNQLLNQFGGFAVGIMRGRELTQAMRQLKIKAGN